MITRETYKNFGFKFNSNSKHVEKILENLNKNEGYCPCALLKNDDTLCPCKDKRQQNICHCKLFI